MISTLIAAGADQAVRNKHGTTPLMIAQEENNREAAEALHCECAHNYGKLSDDRST